jgi:hypothetical protein
VELDSLTLLKIIKGTFMPKIKKINSNWTLKTKEEGKLEGRG